MDKARLESLYNRVRPELKEKLSFKNIMEVPRLSKIVLNVGIKGADSKLLQNAMRVLGVITGQKPVRTKARKSIAGFKLREGMPIGATVTLRRQKMYEFFDRLVGFSLPKVRDFQGVSPKFDGSGNYNMGMKEWSVFPEIESEIREKAQGLNITFQTSSSNDDHARTLLKELGMPFRDKK